MFGIWPFYQTDEGKALVREAARLGDLNEVAALTRLRKRWPAERVRGAIDLLNARKKAADKLELAEHLIADAAGVEQSTSTDVARHKARRYLEAGLDRVADLCCGIGGDAMALKACGRVAMFDFNAPRAWMAHHYVGAPAAVADVTRLDLRGWAYHLDPDRRAGGQRRWSYDDYQPGPAFIEQVARNDGAVKLSPGVDFARLPEGEIEIINRHGTLVQAVLWTGKLARHERTATRIGKEAWGLRPEACDSELQASGLKPQASSFHGTPDLPIPCTTPGKYLLAVDPAVERAGLIGHLCQQLNTPALHPSLGLLTSDRLVSSPWLTPFALLETQPWRQPKVAGWLRENDGGIIEIKTRDRATNPDETQKLLRGEGKTPYTLFVLRQGKQVNCYITRRMQPRG